MLTLESGPSKAATMARGTDKGTGFVFLTVGATVPILSPYEESKKDSRPLISPRGTDEITLIPAKLRCSLEVLSPLHCRRSILHSPSQVLAATVRASTQATGR